MKTRQIRSSFLKVTLPILTALALLSNQAKAQIAVHDGGTNTLTYFPTATLTENITVTPGATALVVLLADHGGTPGKVEPASLTWNGLTLTQAVETAHSQTTARGTAIYYLYNPPPNTTNGVSTNGVNISVTLQGGGSDGWLSWFTLSGTTTTSPPLTNAANSGGQNLASLSFKISGVPAGTFGVFSTTYASTEITQSYTVNGVSAIYGYNVGNGGSTVASGYWPGLSPGNENFVATWTAGTSVQKCNFAGAIFLSPITIPTATATPNPATSGQSVGLSANVTSSAGTITSVNVNASSVGGSASLALTPVGGNVYSNNVVAVNTSFPTNISLPLTVTDSAGNVVVASILFTLVGTNDVWNGSAAPDNTFANGLNWVGGTSPIVGSQVTFAGTTQTNVNMESSSYSLSQLNFNTNAGSFSITNSANFLTLLAGSGVVNNSTNIETLGVPIYLGGALSITAASGNLAFTQPINELTPGTGLLTIAGPGVTVWTGANTFSGNTVINSGALTIGTGGDLGDQGNGTGIYAGSIANNGTLNLFGTNANAQTLSGVISGSGPINVIGGGTNNGAILTLSGANTFTGNLTLSNTYVSDTFVDNNQTPTSSGLGNSTTVGQTITINSNAVLSFDAANPLGNGSTLEQGTIIVNSGGVLQIAAVNGNATVPAIVLNGGTMQAVGTTGFSAQYAAFELGFGLTAGGPSASPSLITAVNSPGAFAEVNLGVNTSAGSQSPWTVNLAGVNPSGAPDLTAAIPLINASDTQAATGLSKSGSGVLALTSPINGYTGPTTISSGTLLLASPGLLGSGTYGGSIINNSTFVSTTTGQTLSGVISGVGTNAIYGSGATLTLTGTNIYTGPTIIGAGGTLFLSGAGSIANSSIITITNGGTLDVTGANSPYTLAAGQSLYGNGIVNGAFVAGFSSAIFPGTDGTYGTNTFSTSLTLNAGATFNFDVGTTYNGANDGIVVNGPLVIGANDFVHLKVPSLSSSLDQTADYVLATATSISGSFNAAPAFDVVPVNGGHYSIVTDPVLKQVRLHYSTVSSPLITSASATPSTVVRNGSVLISLTVQPGAGTITNVSVSLAALGGNTLTLVQQGASNVYTNTTIIPPAAAAGAYNLTASVSDTTPSSAAGNVPLTVASTVETWNGGGGNGNWDTAGNWLSGLAPGYSGDTLVFAGTTGLVPIVDNNYSVPAVTFSNNAGAFVITNANSSVLTLPANAGVTNNSANVETFNLPVQLVGSATLFSATALDSLVFNQPISDTSGSGKIVNAGGTNILNGINTYGGNTVVASGALTIGSGGSLGAGAYSGSISNNGTFNFNGGVSLAGPQTLSGILSGPGKFNIAGGGTTNGALVILSGGQSTFTNNLTLTNTYVSVTGAAAGSQTSGPFGNPSGNGAVTVNNGAILSFDGTGGYEMFPQNSATPNQGLIINNGGLVQITASTTPVGPLTMNGGVLSIQIAGSTGTEPIQLAAGATVGGTSPSIITNNPGIDGQGSGLNLGFFALVGNATFTVAKTGSTGPDLIVGVPLANTSIDGGAVGGLLKAGAGTMELLDLYNTYSGSTTISAGTLILADPGQLGNENGGTYSSLIINSGTFIVSTTSGQTLSGVVSGSGNLIVETNQSSTVNPTATLILTATNTYTGSTIVGPGGDLELQGSINNSALIDVQTNGNLDVTGLAGGFTVNAGQTLRGNGTILQNSSIILTNNGTLSAGETNAIGTLTLSGPLVLTGTSKTALRINKTGGVLTSDMVAGIGAGNATYAGTLTVTNTGTGTLALGDSFTLFGATGGTGNFSSIVGAPPGYGFTFFPNTGVLTVTTAVNTNAATANFAAVKVGGTLQFSWAPDHEGWQLYTNSVGLNTANWFPVPGSASVTNETININPAQPKVFFQLRYP